MANLRFSRILNINIDHQSNKFKDMRFYRQCAIHMNRFKNFLYQKIHFFSHFLRVIRYLLKHKDSVNVDLLKSLTEPSEVRNLIYRIESRQNSSDLISLIKDLHDNELNLESKQNNSNLIKLIKDLYLNESNHTVDKNKIKLSDYTCLIQKILVHPEPGRIMDLFNFCLIVDKPKMETFFDLSSIMKSKNDSEAEPLLTLLSSIAKYKTIWFTPVFSQEGEDLILEQLFGFKKNGFYVDVGCHHPYRFSNTFHLYEKGWQGINIDPIPGTKKLFDEFRPRDLNLEIGLSNTNTTLTYYVMSDSALNSFDKNYIDFICKTTPYTLVEKIEISVINLKSLFENNLNSKDIDFISIDVEGYELPVLQGNDWTRYRPKIVLIEILDFNIQNMNQNPVHNFLVAEKYQIIAMTTRTIFYKDVRSI